MKNFLIYYWLNIILLFVLFYWEVSPLSLAVNSVQMDITVFLTSLTLPFQMMDGYNILITDNYMLVIEKACNGMIPYLFFLASIIAFPARYQHKVEWAIYGYIVLVVINVFRIWLVTQFVLENQSNFSLAHDYIGNMLVIVSALLLFIAFVKTQKRKSHSGSESLSLLRKKNIPVNDVRMTSTI